MNFNIDDRLVQGYNNLPRDFKLSHVMRICGFRQEEKKLVSQQVVRLCKLGVIHRSLMIRRHSGRWWSKSYVKIESWFRAYVKGKTKVQKRKPKEYAPEFAEVKPEVADSPFMGL